MEAALAPVLNRGFADPVFDAQAVFRALLDALAQPGRPRDIAADLAPPAPLTAELAAVALALADADTPVWLDATLAASRPVRDYLRFHTGARLTEDPVEAAFGLVASPSSLPPFDRFAQGTDAYPDRSTTLVVALPDLAGGVPIRLTGPGIETDITIAPPLADLALRLRTNRELFPRGLDLLLVAPGRVLGLPRSVSAAAGSPALEAA